MNDERRPHSIFTVDGNLFDFDDPMSAEITDHDIAHGLGNICRFGGQIVDFYSVAEHAILVCQLVYGHYIEPAHAFAALHHDSPEAYCGDVPTPMKHKLGAGYRHIYRDVEAAVAAHVGVSPDELHAGVIKDADALAMEVEAHVLKPHGWEKHVEVDDDDLERLALRWFHGYEPREAEHAFLRLHFAFINNAIILDKDYIRNYMENRDDEAE